MRAAAERVRAAYSDVRAGGTHQARLERDIAWDVTQRRLADLDIGDAPLVFGRLDMEDAARWYIGRLAVEDEQPHPARRRLARTGRRAVLPGDGGRADGRRAPPPPHHQEGPRGHRPRRRGVRPAGDRTRPASRSRAKARCSPRSNATAPAAWATSSRRSRPNRTRRSAPTSPGVLVVAGGPGTGKTAVALHRAAYLLYTHRRRLASSGVLLVGPSAVFLRYIEQVLPSLGEQDVQLSTLTGLKPRLRVRPRATRATSRALKGDARMAARHRARGRRSRTSARQRARARHRRAAAAHHARRHGSHRRGRAPAARHAQREATARRAPPRRHARRALQGSARPQLPRSRQIDAPPTRHRATAATSRASSIATSRPTRPSRRRSARGEAPPEGWEVGAPRAASAAGPRSRRRSSGAGRCSPARSSSTTSSASPRSSRSAGARRAHRGARSRARTVAATATSAARTLERGRRRADRRGRRAARAGRGRSRRAAGAAAVRRRRARHRDPCDRGPRARTASPTRHRSRTATATARRDATATHRRTPHVRARARRRGAGPHRDAVAHARPPVPVGIDDARRRPRPGQPARCARLVGRRARARADAQSRRSSSRCRSTTARRPRSWTSRARLLAVAAPTVEPSQSVRSTGEQPRFVATTPDDAASSDGRAYVRTVRERTGTLAVIAPADMHATLEAATARPRRRRGRGRSARRADRDPRRDRREGARVRPRRRRRTEPARHRRSRRTAPALRHDHAHDEVARDRALGLAARKGSRPNQPTP